MKETKIPRIAQHTTANRRRQERSVVLGSAAATVAYGRRFADMLKPGSVLLLVGTLGSGKTTFVKGLARGLGITHPITSPTFVLRKNYPLPKALRGIKTLNHVDAYRIPTFTELRGTLDILLEEDRDGIWCIEWGRLFRQNIPRSRLTILRFTVTGKNGRKVAVQH